MKAQRMLPVSVVPADKSQVLADSRKTARKRRLHEIASGLHDDLDAAMEHRADPDHVASEYQIRPNHAMHLFGRRTRRLVRLLQGDVRQLRDEVREIQLLLRRVA